MTVLEPPRVLVIEDDPDYAIVMTTLLRREGYVVTVARDGVSALRCIASEPPALITLDFQLPFVSGDDVLRQLRAHQPQTPVIVLSGEPDVRAYAQALGAAAVLLKPVHLTDFVSTLAAVAPFR
jgi:DNA-binding response OmpR family regulator